MTPDERRERHLLVVDDDDRLRKLIKEFLGRAGFRVTAASNAGRYSSRSVRSSTSVSTRIRLNSWLFTAKCLTLVPTSRLCAPWTKAAATSPAR